MRLFEQGAAGALAVEVPRLDPVTGSEARDRREVLAERRVGGRDDLARAQHAELVIQRLPAVRAHVFRRAEFAGGEVDQGHAGPVGAAGAMASRNDGSRASR